MIAILVILYRLGDVYHSISKIVLEEALLDFDRQIDNAVWVGSYVCCLIHNFLLNNSGIDLAPTIMYVILFKIKFLKKLSL